ncbi:MAG: pyridoxamine 5'-phosphate oxidase family protein [Promethearchaeota archaeon]|jgi:nitroimidazol reductase NimA-like FMN-containing flavoprotein (pyridoxamine 5'-phosphate oxidase superfamily)
MNEKEIKEAITSQNLCRIAFIDNEYPYISPFQYVFIDDTLYFHFTDYGKKKEILSNNTNVCVSIEKFEPDLSSYYFISMQGKLELVENKEMKIEVINQMLQSARSKFSTTFLSAHGFESNKDWDVFTGEGQLIYKFIQVGPSIGLKST